MKNNELDELKPIYIQETTNCPAAGEINLIDLALILVHRKILIGIVLAVCIALGAFYSSTQSSKTSTPYTYETSIYIGNRTVNNSTIYLEPPATLLSKIQYIYIPQLQSSSDNTYSITAYSPKNSGIITLETSSTEDNDIKAIELLNTIKDKSIIEHNKYYESIKSSLEVSLKNQLLPTVEPTMLTDLTLQLASLKPSSTQDRPRITKTEQKTSKKGFKLILAISIFAGLFIGVSMAFFAEFVSKVKKEIDKQ